MFNFYLVTVDGGLTPFGPYSKCTKSCGGGGTQKRTRSCTNPKPLFGGKDCNGPLEQTRACGQNPCQGNAFMSSCDAKLSSCVQPFLLRKKVEISWVVFRPMYGNPWQFWIPDSIMWTPNPRYWIQDSTSVDYGFHDVDSRSQVLDSRSTALDYGFHDVHSRSQVLDSSFHLSGLQIPWCGLQNLGAGFEIPPQWIPDSTRKYFLYFGFQEQLFPGFRDPDYLKHDLCNPKLFDYHLRSHFQNQTLLTKFFHIRGLLDIDAKRYVDSRRITVI